jgi:hypothetical protein
VRANGGGLPQRHCLRDDGHRGNSAAATFEPHRHGCQCPRSKPATAERLLRERRLDESQAAFQSALEEAERDANVRIESQSLIGLSNVFLQKALYVQAREYGLRGLELAERTGQTRDVGQANLILGATADLVGDKPEARDRLQRGVVGF